MPPLRFALTPGEPAGIGPDLCLLLSREAQPHPLIAIASRQLLEQRARTLGVDINLIEVTAERLPTVPAAAGALYVWDTPLGAEATAGQLDTANAAYVLQTLTRAGQGCLDGLFDGMITAPVHKGVINDAGIAFSGHTEFLAAQVPAFASVRVEPADQYARSGDAELADQVGVQDTRDALQALGGDGRRDILERQVGRH